MADVIDGPHNKVICKICYPGDWFLTINTIEALPSLSDGLQ